MIPVSVDEAKEDLDTDVLIASHGFSGDGPMMATLFIIPSPMLHIMVLKCVSLCTISQRTCNMQGNLLIALKSLER